ncbi:hypothetical protein HG702_09050 [Pectobacterium versatile]|nr:hypothetical protein HG702_09050 [Pectobacterium versatile]
MKNNSVNISTLTLNEFLDNNCLTAEQFKKADFSWEELQEIGLAHYDNIPHSLKLQDLYHRYYSKEKMYTLFAGELKILNI